MAFERALRALALLMVAVLLSACAAPPPLFRQMQEQKIGRVRLVVESNPFTYTPPASGETAAAGAPGIALIGALVALGIQARLDTVNTALAKAAAAHGLAVDHRQAFNEALVREFRSRGVHAELVPLPYSIRALGGDRSFAGPVTKDLEALPQDAPVFWLRTDFGSCTISVIMPCIRYTLMPVNHASGAANATRYRGARGTEPSPSRPREQPVTTFKSLDAAVADIEGFDAAFPPLIPRAVASMVEALQRQGRR